MTTILGEGNFRYRVEESWGRIPEGWSYKEVVSVAVDSKDQVYLFNRGEHPMIILDRDGNFIRSWGEDIFTRAHGLHMAPNDTVFCTDEGDHTVRQCTLDGKVLLEIGVAGKPAALQSGEPFHRCTHTALSPQGDIYISDGYGNSRIHKYSPDGKRLFSWGEQGTDPGQFNLPHNVTCDADGWVYVADRENHRIQVFDGNGKYQAQWNNLHRPSGLYMPPGKCPICYIGECGPRLSKNPTTNLGPRITIVDNQGKRIGRLGALHGGNAPGYFISPHGLAVDSSGDLYVAEVSLTGWPNLFPGTPIPHPLRTIQKLVKLPA